MGFLDLPIDLPSLGKQAPFPFFAGRFNLKLTNGVESSLYDRAPDHTVPGTRFAFYQRCAGEAAMVNETELFYLVMLILLTLIIHLVLMMTEPRRDGKAHR
jgi:hypothetical protein